jgi:hypothetical protein
VPGFAHPAVLKDDMLDPLRGQMMAGNQAGLAGVNHRDGKSLRHWVPPRIRQRAGRVSYFAKISSSTAGSGGASPGSLSVISLNMASRPPTLSI